MWQRFTERARRVVFFAQEETSRLGENMVCTEHLLLGIVRENDSAAARILGRLGVSLDGIRTMIDQQAVPGSGRTDADMQLAPRAKRVIDLSYDEARQLNSNYIGTEHLLLGLIREEEGLAGRVLAHLGADLERARQELLKIQIEAQAAVANENQALGAGKSLEPTERMSPLTLPSAGDIGRLTSPENRQGVEVAVDAGAVHDLKDVFLARDGYGYQELLDLGRVFVAAAGERVKNLVLPQGDPAPDSSIFVRILEGVHEGRKGWIPASAFNRVGPDDTPFPPQESSLTIDPED